MLQVGTVVVLEWRGIDVALDCIEAAFHRLCQAVPSVIRLRSGSQTCSCALLPPTAPVDSRAHAAPIAPRRLVHARCEAQARVQGAGHWCRFPGSFAFAAPSVQSVPSATFGGAVCRPATLVAVPRLRRHIEQAEQLGWPEAVRSS